jgi:hypothetical protein
MYSQKDFLDMLTSFRAEVRDLQLEMRETKTLIRDYNGLRAIVNECKERIEKHEAKLEGQSYTQKLGLEKISIMIAAIALAASICIAVLK